MDSRAFTSFSTFGVRGKTVSVILALYFVYNIGLPELEFILGHLSLAF